MREPFGLDENTNSESRRRERKAVVVYEVECEPGVLAKITRHYLCDEDGSIVDLRIAS